MTGAAPSQPDYSILSAFQPIARPPRTSVLYHLGLLLVTVTMLLLPLIYLALVGAAAYGVYYHAVHHWGPIMNFGRVTSGRVMLLKFLFYAVPLFVGAVVVFFMFKPLFAGRPKRAQPLALNPADNPLLYAFIEKICETVGAPSPKRIDLDCELNASAGFRRGMWSMFGNDLVLTIGLPLVANLSAAEFAGVVAHEFGHFTQSVGLRLSYLIRAVNFWFIRVVYQRDAWDYALEQWAAEAEDAWVAIIVFCAQLGVGFARLILRILMFIGLLVGGFMLRQMEYDADAWEIKLAGSENFERTQRKLATLSAAMEKMYKQVRFQWQKNQQLPDNLSELLRQQHAALPPATLQKIEDASGLERTGFFDSHPSLADRIRQARRAQDPGVFHDERPATALFSSFAHPARFVTMLYYTDEVGIPVTESMLVRVQSKTAGAETAGGTAKESNLVDDYFLGVLPVLLPMRFALPLASTNYEADFAELEQLSAGLHQAAGQLEPIATQFREATAQLVNARAVRRLVEAQVPFKPRDFGVSAATLEAAREAEEEAVAQCESLRHSMREVGPALNRRAQLGMALFLANRGELENSEVSPEQLAQAVNWLNYAAGSFAAQQNLTEALAVLDRLHAFRNSEGEAPTFARAWAAQLEAINALHPAGEVAGTTSSKPGLQLQLSTATKNASALESLRQAAAEWQQNYRASLEIVVTAARAVEPAHSEG